MPPARTWLWVSALTGITAFLIYAGTVRVLHPAQHNAFVPERSALAAAVSNVVHGAPLGSVYSGALDLRPATASSTEFFLQEASRDDVRNSKLLPNTAEGMGIGYMMIADVSFRLFGVHIVSVVKSLLALMALSAAAFWFRFPDRRFVVVPLYFGALTAMLFSPMVWAADYAKEIPIGGFRYFSLLGVVPAYHLLLEFLDSRPLAWRWTEIVPVAVQVIVLLTAVLVRNSAVILLGAVALAGLACAWQLRRQRAAAWAVARKAGFMALFGAAFVGVLMLSLPREYLQQGRFTETVWTRVVVSLGMHPKWPFGNLHEVYDCMEHIPRGLVNGTEDQNGHCLWAVYAKQHNLSLDKVGGTYSRDYDAGLRHEFFNILRAYPREVIETFTVIKLEALVATLKTVFSFNLSAVPAPLLWLAAAALANLLVLGLIAPRASTGLAGATALFAAFTIPAYIVGWAFPYTTADLVCLLLIGLGLALVSVLTKARQALAPGS